MSKETKVKFAERLAEGYDLEDPLYVAWRGLKTAVTVSECSEKDDPSIDATSNPIPEFSSLSISSAFKEVLQIPKPVEKKKTRVAAKMPSHISSDEVIRILEDKKKKEEEEAAKAQRKEEREEKRRQREKEKEIRVARGRGKRGGARGRGRGRESDRGRSRGTGRGRGRGRGKKIPQQELEHTATSSSDTSSDESNGDVICPVCKVPESQDSENTEWVQCDNSNCSVWYHVTCTNIDPEDYHTLGSTTWLCPNCRRYSLIFYFLVFK